MGVKKNFLVLLFHILTIYCQKEPFISFISKETYSDIGESAELRCTVHFAYSYPVLWMREPDLFISTGETKIVPEERFQITREDGPNEESTYVLKIFNLQETDSNTYICKIQKEAGDVISDKADLKIRRAPIITDDSSRDMNVVEGSNVTLVCDAHGYPPPQITWRHVGDEILQTGSSIYNGTELRLTKVTKRDRGIYACVAENGMPQGARRNIALYIEFMPQVYTPQPTVGQQFLYDAELECIVEAFPQPAISWIFKGEVIQDDMHYTVTNYLGTGEKITTKLRLLSIEQRQYGTYECKAVNKLGMGKVDITLYETYIPNPHFAEGFSPISEVNS